jgi:hypothetical protein
MTSNKRGRVELPVSASPIVDKPAINARICIAVTELDAPGLVTITKDLKSARSWLDETLAELEAHLEQAEEARTQAKDRSVLEAAALALPPGGAVATFDERLWEALFEGPLKPGGRAEDLLFMRTEADICVSGIPVKIKPGCRDMKLDTVQETYTGLRVDFDPLIDTRLEAIMASSRAAIEALVKSTPMRKVVGLD